MNETNNCVGTIASPYRGEEVPSDTRTYMAEPNSIYGNSERVAPQAITTSGGDKIRNFNVEQLNYGYVVTVGCHRFAVSSAKKLTRLLSQYIDNPSETEALWFKGELI